MNLKKLNALGSIGLALFLASSAQAQDYNWTGTAGDGLWSTGGNWNHGTPPPSTAGNTFLGSGNITIQAGEVQTPGLSTAFTTIFGPDWGGTLNIHGTLNYNWYLAPVQWDSANPSTVNMYGNSSLSGEGIALGYTWWYAGGPYANLNMHGNSTATVNWLWWGGKLNLHGGTLTINSGVNDGTTGAVSDATRLMNITGGTLVLGWGDQTTLVNDWVNRGILQAYGGAGTLNVNVVGGQTIITAVPEPSALTVLGLGALAMVQFIRRRK